MDLRSYIKSKNGGAAEEAVKSDEEKARDMISKYAGKSQEELMEELSRVAAQQKADGTLNNDQLKQMADQLSPMLGEEQRDKMSALINMLSQN